MEAKEEIYQYIRENIKEDGVTAQSIAEIFEIKRNVASHYLNLLEKEGKLQKGTNRPVHFSIPADTEKKAEEYNNMIDERPAAQKEVSVFSKFIGYNGSMEQVIEKFKAAVNYPVNGLTMIICGASGVGKSYLASLIHQYAVESGAVEVFARQLLRAIRKSASCFHTLRYRCCYSNMTMESRCRIIS